MGAQGSSSTPPEGSNPAFLGQSAGQMGASTPKGSSSAPLSQPEMSAQTSANPAMAYSYTNPNNVNGMAQQWSGQNQMGSQQMGQMVQPMQGRGYGQPQGQSLMERMSTYQPPVHFMDRMRNQGVPMPAGFGQLPPGYQGTFEQLLDRLPQGFRDSPAFQQNYSRIAGMFGAPATAAAVEPAPVATNPAAEIQTSQPRGFGDFKRGGAVSGRKLTGKEMATLREALAIARRILPKG